MNYCDLTFPTPEENLACDEALLDAAEAGGAKEILRVWESPRYFVVLGYANKISSEVNLSFCRANTLSVLRRCTGGGTVMQGPGLLNFSLILPLEPAPQLQSITAANEYIMERHRSVFSRLLQAPVEICGHTDLAIGGLKFSGNAQRRKKHCLLFHGSFLLHFDIEMIEKALPMPSKEPTYRYGRSHSAFLMNLKVRPELVKRTLCEAWNAHSPLRRIPVEHVDALVAGKYSRDEWNSRF